MVRVPVAGHDLLVSPYEVTTASWNRCYSEGGCSHNVDALAVDGSFPATGVNWFDVQEYLKWANHRAGGGLRLPTISEWRVIDRTLVHDKLAPLFTDPRMAWAANYGQEKVVSGPVQQSGTFSTTPEGISDLDGNVWEWTSSCFKSGFENDCPAYIVAGEHEAIVSVFVGEPAFGGCATGTPPTHLGFRLVADR
jgi:formylglycine-generating enzyme required for sulfatase activity